MWVCSVITVEYSFSCILFDCSPSRSHKGDAPNRSQTTPQQHSNNRRTLWYTVLEVLTLTAVGAFNVYIVSRMFKGHGGGRFGPYGRIVV